jgi:hypothetical protein
MIYVWCYALCRACTTLNNTDASALVECWHVGHWHWRGFYLVKFSLINFITSSISISLSSSISSMLGRTS